MWLERVSTSQQRGEEAENERREFGNTFILLFNLRAGNQRRAPVSQLPSTGKQLANQCHWHSHKVSLNRILRLPMYDETKKRRQKKQLFE